MRAQRMNNAMAYLDSASERDNDSIVLIDPAASAYGMELVRSFASEEWTTGGHHYVRTNRLCLRIIEREVAAQQRGGK